MAESGGTVGGRYALVERVGNGAMGVVWRARDELLDREVAVKQLRWPDLTADEVAVARARAMREARNAARLQHPDAISVFDLVVEDDRPWLVMEYLPARSLAALLAERGGLDPAEAARIGGRVANALAAAHAAGIVHRDVKPSNVLIGHDGTVKLTDFGISRATGDGTLTDRGMITGTPAYLAPEVARGEQPGQASDVFSLGATLYAAIEGRSPHGVSDNSFGLLYRAAVGRIEPPTRSGPLTGVLLELLAADPTARPTATEAAELLTGHALAEPNRAAGQDKQTGRAGQSERAKPSERNAQDKGAEPEEAAGQREAERGAEAEVPAGARAARGTAVEHERAADTRASTVERERATGTQGPAIEHERIAGARGPAVEREWAAGAPGAAVEGNQAAGAPGSAVERAEAVSGAPAKRKRGWVAPVVASVVLLVVAGAVALVALRPELFSAFGIAQPAYTPGDAEELVRYQYQLLPENTPVAWDNLAESYRRPYPEYEKFWSQYDDVRTDRFEVWADHPTRFIVRARVTFVQAGAETAGNYQLVVEPVDGRLRIMSSELLL